MFSNYIIDLTTKPITLLILILCALNKGRPLLSRTRQCKIIVRLSSWGSWKRNGVYTSMFWHYTCSMYTVYCSIMLCVVTWFCTSKSSR